MKPRSQPTGHTEKKIEQALLNRILYIGDEIPASLCLDDRPKFILLGSPMELIKELGHDLDYGQSPRT